MPIDKYGIIQPKSKRNRLNIKNLCLVITTCISVLGFCVVLYQYRLQKLEYENILKENNIQLKSSYIRCHVNYIENLFKSLEDNNVKILSNKITEQFYDKKAKQFYSAQDITSRDKDLQKKYDYAYPEVIFLKIEVISNRLVRNACIDFIKIYEKNNINSTFRMFGDLEDEDYYKRGKQVTLSIGDVKPNDTILIPVVLKYSDAGFYTLENIEDMEEESIFKIIYVPKNILCYDDFCEEEKKFRVRDVLEDSLVTEYYFEEQG